jgi:hypothetical protein
MDSLRPTFFDHRMRITHADLSMVHFSWCGEIGIVVKRVIW